MDEDTEERIEIACGFLNVALQNLALNDGEDDEYQTVLERIGEVQMLADEIRGDQYQREQIASANSPEIPR